MHQNTARIIACISLLAAAFWIAWQLQDQSSMTPERSIRLIRLASARNADEGWQQAQAVLAEFPVNHEVAAAAADAAATAGQLPEVLQIIADHPISDFLIGEAALQLLLDSGHHRLAESSLNARIAQNPHEVAALQKRSELLLKQGRLSLARRDLHALLKRAAIPLDSLVFLCSRREFLGDPERLAAALEVDPGYAPSFVGRGVLAAFEGQLDEAEQALTKAVELDDQLPDAWGNLGLVHYQQGDKEQGLAQWRRQVIDKDIRHADVSFVLGWLAEQAGDEPQAISILTDALQDSPRHRACCQLLSTILARQPEGESAALFLAGRAGLIHDLEVLMHDVLFGNRTSARFQTAAELCGKLGATDLAVAWAGAVGADRNSDLLASIKSNARSAEIGMQEILSRWQDVLLPNAGRALDRPATVDRPVSESNSSREFRLEDISSEIGLTPSYYGGFDDFESGLWVYQGFGGGVGVLDFDSDDQPDLILTQASKWGTTKSLPREQQDLLYRSCHGTFQQVNGLAFDPEREFGQGVAVGDVNRDGFDDIYVANIGPNRLLMNNGDGTFEAVAMPSSTTESSEWTTSCMLADLDGDGLDEIYDVQYVSGPEPFEKVCRSGSQQLVRSCLPSLFDAASDRLLRNLGNDSFDDQSQSSGLASQQGRGLGIVATNLDGIPGLELFVSNDMTANHYLQVGHKATTFTIRDLAELKGLARNGQGQLEACMGIAAEDFSGDGLTDLLVTNFFEETNTFYEALPGGFFRDQTAVVGLGTSSRKKLGFGTQAMDFDLDGDLDLLIANGHVDNYTHMNAPWKMNVDLMENIGNGQFRRRPDSDCGTYGEIPTLGRSVARLDWNRDGLPDAAITHLDRGPALLTNRTERKGNFVTFKLVGTQSNRPGVGTIVNARFNDSKTTVQQNAGDGYYCSNERSITIGVGDAKILTEVEVCWPSGKLVTYADVQVGARYVVVEGRDKMYPLIP